MVGMIFSVAGSSKWKLGGIQRPIKTHTHTHRANRNGGSSILFSSCVSIAARVPSIAGTTTLSSPNSFHLGSSFVSGSSLRLNSNHKLMHQTLLQKTTRKALSIRSEQSSKGGSSLDVWLGRVAMIGFTVAITIEVSTGKGLLENFGLTSPLPTIALALTALVGVLTAVFIFQSGSDN